MRIVHLLNTNSFSGAENVAIQIIEKTGGGDEAWYCSPAGKIEEVLKKRNVRYFPLQKLSVKEVKRVVSTLHPDIIHAHDFRAGLYAVLACKDIPVVSHLHNNCPWLGKPGLRSFLFRYIAKRCGVILTVSDSVMNEFVFGKRFFGKTVVVGNPVDLGKIRQNGASGSHDECDLLFCGRLTEQKDPALFLRIVKRLTGSFPDLRAIMLGDGELMQEIRRTVKERQLEKNVTLAGFVDDPVSYMAGAKVLAVTSSWEGFGLVAVEALAVGTPVVASNVGGLPSIVNDRCGALCNREDDFVREIGRLLSDEAYYLDKSRGASARADELNNAETYMQKIKQAYLSVSEKR